MIMVSTKTIKQLNFNIFGVTAISVLADYLDYNYVKSSIEQHIPVVTKFLVYIHENCSDIINQTTVNGYIDLLFKGTYSTACMSRSHINQFIKHLKIRGLCAEIKIKPAPSESTIMGNGIDNKSCFKSCDRLKNTYRYYDLFGIKFNASLIEIKKAYHKLALSYHPDVCKERFATERFSSIVHIYEILSDKEKRFEYDVTMGFVSGYTEKIKSDYSVKF